MEGYQGDDPAIVPLLPWLPDRPGIRADIADCNGMVYALDEAVGEVLAALEESGLAEETLVIFTTTTASRCPAPRAPATTRHEDRAPHALPGGLQRRRAG